MKSTAAYSVHPPQLSCVLGPVSAAGCNVVDVDALSTCFCTNTTVLAAVSVCVRLECDVPDQVQSSGILQGQLCQRFPVPSRAAGLRAATVVSIVVAIASVTLRWVARCQSSRLGWDDYAALGAAVSLVGNASVQLAGVSLGFGKHVWNVDPRDAFPLLQLYWASQQLYILAQLLIKVSILALFLRVFTERWFRISAIVGIAAITLQDTLYCFSVLVRCLPIQAIWDVRTPGRCLDLNIIGISGAVLNIVEHFIILLLPLPALWKLRLSRKKRVQLALVFGIGSFSCITSIIRLIYSPNFTPTEDLSWDTVAVVEWSLIEGVSAVVCMNLPPCRHLIGRVLHKGRLLTSNSADTSKPSQWQYLATGSTMNSRDMYENKRPLVFTGTVTTISAAHTEDMSNSKSKSIVSTISKISTISRTSTGSESPGPT